VCVGVCVCVSVCLRVCVLVTAVHVAAGAHSSHSRYNGDQWRPQHRRSDTADHCPSSAAVWRHVTWQTDADTHAPAQTEERQRTARLQGKQRHTLYVYANYTVDHCSFTFFYQWKPILEVVWRSWGAVSHLLPPLLYPLSQSTTPLLLS